MDGPNCDWHIPAHNTYLGVDCFQESSDEGRAKVWLVPCHRCDDHQQVGTVQRISLVLIQNLHASMPFLEFQTFFEISRVESIWYHSKVSFKYKNLIQL